MCTLTICRSCWWTTRRKGSVVVMTIVHRHLLLPNIIAVLVNGKRGCCRFPHLPIIDLTATATLVRGEPSGGGRHRESDPLRGGDMIVIVLTQDEKRRDRPVNHPETINEVVTSMTVIITIETKRDTAPSVDDKIARG
mmetsp:Transcript_83662/g.97879  ORF Transcript_83662/g.97879 Transcript_83662/m.97879 type:complete len:138 (+) Transcript_83662:200-613(+)